MAPSSAMGRILLVIFALGAVASSAATAAVVVEEPQQAANEAPQQQQPQAQEEEEGAVKQGSLRRRRVEGSAIVMPEKKRRSTQGGFFTLADERNVTVTLATTTTSTEVVEKAAEASQETGSGGDSSRDQLPFEPVMGTVGFSLPDMIVSLLMQLRPDAPPPRPGNNGNGGGGVDFPDAMLIMPASLSMMSGFMRIPSGCVKQELITFDQDMAGNVLESGMLVNDTILFDGGVSFAARTTQDAISRDRKRIYFDDGMLFDAGMDPSLTRDKDLITHPQQGNMLIIAKKRLLTPANPVPDDNGQGGLLRGTFAEPVTLNFITLVDVEEHGAVVRLYGGADERTPFREVILPPGEDGQLRVMTIQETGVTKFTIKVTGSGALDDVVFTRPCDP